MALEKPQVSQISQGYRLKAGEGFRLYRKTRSDIELPEDGKLVSILLYKRRNAESKEELVLRSEDAHPSQAASIGAEVDL